MKVTILAFVIVSLTLVTGSAVAGYGAIAYDQDARKQGSAWDEDTQQHANDAALRDCGSDGCKVRFGVPPASAQGLRPRKPAMHGAVPSETSSMSDDLPR